MDKYIGIEDRKVYYLVPVLEHDKKTAIKAANKIIKKNVSMLRIRIGYVADEKLYWSNPSPGADMVWAVWKE